MSVSVPRPQVVQVLVRRDYLISRSYRYTILLDVLFGLLSLLTFYFISRTFPHTSAAALDGAPSYFAFASVGIALGLVVQTASLRVAQRIREEQLTGTLENLVSQPVSATELSLGLAGFQFLFAMVRATLYLLVAAVLLGVDLPHADWLGYVIVVVTTGIAMGAIGIVLAGAVLILKRAEMLGLLVTYAISTFGGALFPVSVFPGWLQPLALVVPARYAFDGVRAALFRGHGWGDEAAVLAAFAVVAFPLALLAFSSALRLAKRRGSLGIY